MCGLPFARGSFAAQLIAAPVPAPAAYQGRAEYWSELVVRRDSPYRTLADTFGHRIAFTVADSQSGYAAPLNFLRTLPGDFPRYREVVAPCITPLGALTAVIDGSADIAPVDSYAFSLFCKYRPELTAQVRTVARTLGDSGEVACQRSTQAAHCGLVPSMPGALFRPVRTGGSQ